ncbi:MAG: aminotransferase class V-fold PLP-dependent enzyme [Gemmatimonadetes bacterium]|nr:aminotransferase class V-fold PLP-dependent enzyme [Gemmatimonadota bacterium]
MKRLTSFRDEFPISRTHIFLNHAGVAPTSLRAAAAVNGFMDSLARLGRPSFDDWESLAAGCRDRFARLVGCASDEVAFVRNTSHGLSLLASGLDWRPGDRVAAALSVEYPSNAYPWMDLDRRGIASLDVIPAGAGGTVTVEAASRAIGPRTRVLAVSSAQYASGAVTDLIGLGRLCRERGVLFCVDGIQTVGALPTDVKEAGIHFLSADSHKWMLGIMGIGAVFVDRSVVERVHPPLLGWRSTTDAFNFDRVHFELLGDAGRYEEGSLAYPLIAGFSAALDLLEEAGIDRVAEHICALVADLAGRLEALGCVVAPDPEQRRHILTFHHDHLGGEQLLEALEAAGVVASLRRGRVRVSPHLYNTHDEMRRVAQAVRAALPEPRTLKKGPLR